MRAVVQRIDRARVGVDGAILSEIGKGVLVFLGIEKWDGEKDAECLFHKILHLRLFDDAEGKMNLSLEDIKGEMMVISQFTLLADCRKGRRPSFIAAEDPAPARLLYEYFIRIGRDRLGRIGSGQFQAMMKIDSVNDGPVTLVLDSRGAWRT